MAKRRSFGRETKEHDKQFVRDVFRMFGEAAEKSVTERRLDQAREERGDLVFETSGFRFANSKKRVLFPAVKQYLDWRADRVRLRRLGKRRRLVRGLIKAAREYVMKLELELQEISPARLDGWLRDLESMTEKLMLHLGREPEAPVGTAGEIREKAERLEGLRSLMMHAGELVSRHADAAGSGLGPRDALKDMARRRSALDPKTRQELRDLRDERDALRAELQILRARTG